MIIIPISQMRKLRHDHFSGPNYYLRSCPHIQSKSCENSLKPTQTPTGEVLLGNQHSLWNPIKLLYLQYCFINQKHISQQKILPQNIWLRNTLYLYCICLNIRVIYKLTPDLERELMSQNAFNSNTQTLCVLQNYAFHSLNFTKIENSSGYVSYISNQSGRLPTTFDKIKVSTN